MGDEEAPPLAYPYSLSDDSQEGEYLPDDYLAVEKEEFPEDPAVPGAIKVPDPLAGTIQTGLVLAKSLGAGGGREIGGLLSTDGLGEHLNEARKRIIVSAAAFLPLFALGLAFYQSLWDFLLLPLGKIEPKLVRFQALGPSDGLVLAMKIAFAFALMATMPVWLAQIWCFVAPALNGREKRWLYLALGLGGGLFFLGAVVAYFVGIPFALAYLLPLNQSLAGWENAFTGSGYVDFVVTCCLGFGFAFELPLVMLLLGWFTLLTPEGIRAWWKHVVVGIFVVAAVMTPPDPFSQLLLALPMMVLFFVGYLLVVWVSRR